MIERQIRSKIRFQRPCRPGMTACWMWTGYIHQPNGTGMVYIDADHEQSAHIYVYEKYRGPLPDHKRLKRLCTRKECVNPNHLTAVVKRRYA